MSDKWARQWNTKARHVPRITQLYNDYRLLDEDYPIKGAKAALACISHHVARRSA